MEESAYLTAAEYLGYRLRDLGCTHLFVVPGDYNLPLLDGLMMVPGLTLVNTANELNAGYAADGHARSQGLGCVVTTFLVGALSAINATAASFAEEIPVLSVVGVPNTSQYAKSCAIHHSLGNMEDMSQEVDCYRVVTCYQTILRSLTDARYLIDKALNKALSHRKPALLEVCRDVALLPHPSFGRRGAPLDPLPRPFRPCDEASLAAAAEAVAEWLAAKQRPVIVVGRQARNYQQHLVEFAEALGCAVTTVADGKGFFPESHPQFIGTHFKAFTDPVSIADTVAASDALVFVGMHFNEMSWPTIPNNQTHERSVIIYKSRAVLALTRVFTMVPTSRLLAALTQRVKRNPASLELFASLPRDGPELPSGGPDFTPPDDAPLKTQQLYEIVQTRLLASPGYDIVVDTGDSLWRTHRLRLPAGAAYETQCLAGNIGAGLPTGLGFSLGAAGRTGHRTIIFQGDGGLQMTANDLGSFVRFGSNAIVIVINNSGYLVERVLSPIAHSTYNYLAPWAYADVAEAMCRHVPGGKFSAARVTTAEEFEAAILDAKDKPDHFIFIEAIVSSTDAAPGAGLMRRMFAGAFFSSIPAYQRRLANELGKDFIKAAAGDAIKRTTSDSLAEAYAAAAALSARASGEFARRSGEFAAANGGGLKAAAAVANGGDEGNPFAAAAAASASRPSMPTIDSVGSVASLVGSGTSAGSDPNLAREAAANAARE